MKLVTYEIGGCEKWGFAVEDPNTAQMCVVSPQDVEELLPQLCRPTNFFGVNVPKFLPAEARWPDDLVGFLEMGDAGLEALRKVEQFVCSFLTDHDYFLMRSALHPISSVRMKAPVPRPRLYWGLVRNMPAFFRENPNMKFVNLLCEGHQRTQAACTGYDGYMVFYNGERSFPASFTCELGVIIGKYGKNIPASEALEYVAGYTNIIDATCNPVKLDFGDRMGKDWHIDATGDWIGKKNDTMGAMGPYLTTRDEVTNPYNLLSWSRQNGVYRDRGFSGELILGIERTIEFYSSIAALHPGDVIHMGAMQADGMLLTPDAGYGKDDNVEVEIEKLGALRVHFLNPDADDWRPEDDPSRTIHHSDAVRELILAKKDVLASPEDFDASQVRHFWTAFGNYQKAEEQEGLMRLEDIPRMLNNPGRAVSANTRGVLSKRTKAVKVGIELCAVVKKVAYKVTEQDAGDYILGYSPMVTVNDQSLRELVKEEFATAQDKALPAIYGRWGDGYNIVLPVPVKKAEDNVMHAEMSVQIDGIGEMKTTAQEYIVAPERMLSRLSQYLTLFPGDIITLGRTAVLLEVPEETVATGFCGSGWIEGLGEIHFDFTKEY